LLKGEAGAQNFPHAGCHTVDRLPSAARKSLVTAQSKIKDLGFRNSGVPAADISIQSGTGATSSPQSFARQRSRDLRAFEHLPALERAVGLYKKARAAWASFAAEAKSVYRSDVTFVRNISNAVIGWTGWRPSMPISPTWKNA